MEDTRSAQHDGEALRVAVLTTSYPLVPGNSSGIFVARLLEAMPDEVGISVITPASRREASARSGKLLVRPVRYAPQSWQCLAHEPGGIPVALRGNPWLRCLIPLLIATLAFRIWREARTHQLLHANWAFNGCVAGVAGRLTGCPVLTSLRGEDVSRARDCWFARQILGLAVRLSGGLVTVSTDMARWLEEAFPSAAGKITVVENGVDAAFLAAGIKRHNRPPRAVLVIACAGSLIPRKGHDVLLRALARCTEHAWTLRLAGEGRERGNLERLAGELGLSDRIEFQGELPPEAMPDFLADADMFVLPSFSEGRPNALLEAMAAGLPVVASAIDGVTELVDDGHTGQLFPPGDHLGLAAVLRPLLQEAAVRNRLGTAAHLEVSRRQLTWAGAAEKHVALYRQLLRRT